MRLFVYGSLMSGETAHGLLAAARFVGPATSAPGFELTLLDGYPGLLRGGSTAVSGELYEVDASALPALDAYEGHPRLFARERIRLADGSEAEAYLLDPALARGRPRIASGDWRAR